MVFDTEATLKAIFAALKGEAGATFSNITPLARSSVRLLAKQAEFLTQARLDGSLSDAEFQAEMAGIEKQSKIVAKAVAQLIQIGQIKAKDAIFGILKKAAKTTLQTQGLGFLVP